MVQIYALCFYVTVARSSLLLLINKLPPTPSNVFTSSVTSAKPPYSQYAWLSPMSPKSQLLGKEQLV